MVLARRSRSSHGPGRGREVDALTILADYFSRMSGMEWTHSSSAQTPHDHSRICEWRPGHPVIHGLIFTKTNTGSDFAILFLYHGFPTGFTYQRSVV